MSRHQHNGSEGGIAGTSYGDSPSLHRGEQTQLLLFASLALIIVLMVTVTLLFVKEKRDTSCARDALRQRSQITVRDTQLQDALDRALGVALAAILNPNSTEPQRRAAVETLLRAEKDHASARAADDKARAAHPLTSHC